MAGCIGAGTHGSLKSFQFPVMKDSLQNAIMSIINNNPHIQRDTTLDHLGSSPALDHNDDSTPGDYSAGENYYNDIKHYVTIKITSEHDTFDYTFRYYGADKDWKTSRVSEIFICYAYKNGKGGSEGNGGVSGNLLKELTDVFERELIYNVDEKLNVKHTSGDK